MRKKCFEILNTSMDEFTETIVGLRDKLSTELIKFNFLDFQSENCFTVVFNQFFVAWGNF